VLDVDRQRAVRPVCELAPVADRVAVDRIGDHELIGEAVHRHRPERVDLWHLVLFKTHHIVVLRAIEWIAPGVAITEGIVRLDGVVAIESHHRCEGAHQVLGPHCLARAKETVDSLPAVVGAHRDSLQLTRFRRGIVQRHHCPTSARVDSVP